jgi:beta-lactamase superfamily II metal-dependent hydrolase
LIASWFTLVIEKLGSLPVAALSMPYFPVRWLLAAGVINGGVLAGIKLRQFFWQRRVWGALGFGLVITTALLLVRPDGRVHVYALDVGTGSAVLIRTGNGHQILIDAGPDADKFAQAVGRAIPPTARTLDLWLITNGNRVSIGGGAAVLQRFHVNAIAVADPNAWSYTLRSLVQQAEAAGAQLGAGSGPFSDDGVTVSLAGDGISWLIQTASGRIAVIPPQSAWMSSPTEVDGDIFTSGGPSDWQGPGRGFSVIEVDKNSRDGLPIRAVLQAMAGAPIYRTDRLGTVGLVDSPTGFSRSTDGS